MRFLGKILLILLSSLFAFLTLGAVGLFGIYAYYAPKLPDDKELRKIDVQVPLRIYTKDNQLLAEYGEKRSHPVKLERVPKHLKYAFLDIEDARFYEHQGVDLKGMARAVYSVISTGSASQGASTVTMQLARNAFLNSGKTVDRKLRETLLAIKLEQNLSKDEILELYFNKIYLGNRAYGIAAAAEVYYGKTLDQLTLAQAAMIAGLPKAPSRYNPIVNPERAMIRRDYILKRMKEFNHISQAEYDAALKEPNTAQVHKTEFETEAPYLAEMVRAEIVKRFNEDNAYTQGYHVYTTLDAKQQAEAASALQNALLTYDHRHGYRGAEDNIDVDEFKSEEDLLDKLSDYPTLGGLVAGVVQQVDSKNAEVLTSNEKKITLNLDNVSWARKFHSADRRGGAPRRVSDVLHKGDIIRLRQTDKDKDTWTLSQVPTVAGALVSMDPHNGAIRAVMGGFDYNHSKFNRATQAMRQPGSSFKPIVYTAALAKGYSPNSIVNDAPITIPGSNWRPENFGGSYIGPTTLAEALAKSRNLVSVRVMKSIGVKYTVDFATKFGFERKNLPANLTLSLGTAMVTPLDMATAYSTFANGGYKVSPYFITRIEDAEGKVLVEEKPVLVCGDKTDVCKIEKHIKPDEAEAEINDATTDDKTANTTEAGTDTDAPKPSWELTDNKTPGDAKTKSNKDGKDKDKTATKEQAPKEYVEYPAAKRILDKRTHYQIVSMLQGVTQFGTAARASKVLGRKDIAGKTGTTNDQKDAWFCGFSPSVVTISWMGFDDMAKLGEGETGTNVALPMWIDYMQSVLKDRPVKEWQRPADMKAPKVEELPSLNGDGEVNKEAATSDTDAKEVKPTVPVNVPKPAAPTKGFEYKREQDLRPQRPAANHNQPTNRPAPPPRRPERVEIPEQLF
jgi:penicillin-binding protein 1A